MSQYAMIVNYGYCTSCFSCEVSCSKKNDIPEGQWGIKLSEYGPKKLGGEWEWDYVAVPSRLCNLCEDRLAEGKKPMCELHCVANCIEVLPLEDAPQRMSELGEKTACFIPRVIEL